MTCNTMANTLKVESEKLSINYLNWSNKKVETLNRPVTTEEIAKLLRDILRNIQSKIVLQLNSV